MDFSLIWTERALSDLEAIVRYYRHEKKSIHAASTVGKALLARVELLRQFPDIGPLYPRKSGIHRELLCYEYRIFYRVDDKAKVIFITRIWHGRQDPEFLEL